MRRYSGMLIFHGRVKVSGSVIVEGYQAKDRSTRANGRNITFADGRKLFVGSEGTGAPK